MAHKKLLLIFFLFLISLISAFATPSIQVSGTEYQVNDTAQSFIQLLDDGHPINNANCFMDIFYPNRTIYLNNVVANYVTDSDGIYYLQQNIPNLTGVYIVTATCKYSFEQYQIYNPDFYPFSNSLVSNISSIPNPNALNSWNTLNKADNLYVEQDSVNIGVRTNNLTLQWNLSEFTGTNFSNSSLEVQWQGQSSSANNIVIMALWNWNTNVFDQLPIQLQMGGQASSSTPSENDQFFSNRVSNITDYLNSDNLVRARFGAVNGGATFTTFHNMINIVLIPIQEFSFEVKGSSEWHVSSDVAETKSLLNQILTYLTGTIWTQLLQITGIVTTNQQILNQSLQNENQTRIQISNISTQLSATNNSIITAISGINVSFTGNVSVTADLTGVATKSDIVALNQTIITNRQNISDYFENWVGGESIG